MQSKNQNRKYEIELFLYGEAPKMSQRVFCERPVTVLQKEVKLAANRLEARAVSATSCCSPNGDMAKIDKNRVPTIANATAGKILLIRRE